MSTAHEDGGHPHCAERELRLHERSFAGSDVRDVDEGGSHGRMSDTMAPDIPDIVIAMLDGDPVVGAPEQGFALLTVDVAGFPHVCLLSRAELEADRDEIRVALASRRTGENLSRDMRGTLIAVQGTSAHYLKLDVTRIVQTATRLGVALTCADHAVDDVGVELAPIGFTPSHELAQLESWDQSAACLAELRASKQV